MGLIYIEHAAFLFHIHNTIAEKWTKRIDTTIIYMSKPKISSYKSCVTFCNVLATLNFSAEKKYTLQC